MLSMNCSYLLFFFICFSARTRICGASSSFLQEPIQVEIITVGNIYSNVSLSNLPYVAPGMIVALDQLRQTFAHRANFTHTLLYDKRYTSCPLFTDNVDFLVAEYFYTRRKTNSNMTVFIGVGCTERTAMGKLISGWNAFMTIGGTAETIFRNKTLYPNVVLAGNNAVKSMHNIYTKFFQRFLWTSVYILLDASATPVHLLLIQNFVSGLAAKGFRVKFANTNMGNPEKINLGGILRDMRISARVVVFLGHASDLRKFMLQVKRAQMTNGEYVYLAHEPFRHRSFYGNYTWKYGDKFDEEAQLAYQSVFLVTFPQDSSSNGRLVGLYETFTNISKHYFNFTYAPLETPNPFVTAAYEDVILFGHVLEETLNDPSRVVDLNDGSAFARRYWNRTFWLDTGPIEFDEVGERKQPLIIQQFQKGGVWPTTIMTLDASANEFVDVASISWVAPFPPPNEPPCGFLGANVICWKKDAYFTIVIASVMSVLLVLMLLLLLWARIWRRSLLQDVPKSFGWLDFQVQGDLIKPRPQQRMVDRYSRSDYR
ncbi:hypothetical protein RvY_13341 [Ramazzottius varieornatus]|uniref:Receptor ligand binding region domain-containing protein n=1 Tax=Ramazzottius varieornatus TaxID=947166 RepID=A0A1D1VRK6_RAMVA|nr:hypothetical protein RvY_13341 [Ramazzottius varieornatus]